MNNTPLGASVTLTAQFYDANNALVNPVSAVFTMTGPLGTQEFGGHWPTPQGGDSVTVTNPSTGNLQVILTPPVANLHKWSFVATQPDSVVPGSVNVVDFGGYPCNTGYANYQDIQARVAGGGWNALGTGNGSQALTVQDVNDFLIQATAEVDAALMRRGYMVPLTPSITTQPISWQVWETLRNITAWLAAAHIETRRVVTSSDAAAMTKAKEFLSNAMALVTNLETGVVNLTVFNVQGPFEPQADASLGETSGGLSDMLGNPTQPIFTRDMRL